MARLWTSASCASCAPAGSRGDQPAVPCTQGTSYRSKQVVATCAEEARRRRSKDVCHTIDIFALKKSVEFLVCLHASSSSRDKGSSLMRWCHAAGCSRSPSWGRSRSWCLSNTVIGVWMQPGPGMHPSRDLDMHFAMTACRHSGPMDTALRLPLAAPWARSLLALGSAAWCCVAGPRRHTFSKVLYRAFTRGH